jgi:Fic family protein
MTSPAPVDKRNAPGGGKKPDVPPPPQLTPRQIRNLEQWVQQNEPAPKKAK